MTQPQAHWLAEDEYGPPTVADDWWFLENVIAAGYPKPRRDPAPYPGQTTIEDFPRCAWTVTAKTGESIGGCVLAEGHPGVHRLT